MGNSAWFGNVGGDWGYRGRRIVKRESVAVLSDGELDGGGRTIMWMSP